MSYAYDAALAAAALKHVRSVDYKVGLRWVFYRLLQDGLLKDKADYARLKDILSQARKEFRDGWAPYTLVDSGRSISESRQPIDAAAMLSELPYYVRLRPDLFEGQGAVPFLIFEAETSAGQFESFVPWADRAAFRGDASVPHKWDIAKRCDDLAERYGLPVHVLYFGDLDKKGLSIPKSAMSDVLGWVDGATDVRFTRIGINADHAERFNLPEKPESPGTFEWEALPPDAAHKLVHEGLALVVEVDTIQARLEAAEGDSETLAAKVASALAMVLP